MYTRCPKCQELFELGARELRIGGGEVVCGGCRIIFNALNTLADEPEDVASAAPRSFRLPTLEPSEPVSPDVDEEDEEDVFGADEALIPGESPRSARPVSRPPSSVPVAPPATALWTFASLASVVVLLWQWWGLERDVLAQDSAWRPWVESACVVLHCGLAARRDLAHIEILNRRLAPLEGATEGLEFHALLANYADMPQAFPRLKLTLTHFDGDPVARRVFGPEDYLAQPVPGDMPVGASFEIRLMLAPLPGSIGGHTVELL